VVAEESVLAVLVAALVALGTSASVSHGRRRGAYGDTTTLTLVVNPPCSVEQISVIGHYRGGCL